MYQRKDKNNTQQLIERGARKKKKKGVRSRPTDTNVSKSMGEGESCASPGEGCVRAHIHTVAHQLDSNLQAAV